MTKQKNILITGGAGFIGSTFVRLVTNKGYNVVVVDNLTYAGHLENLDGCISEITFVKANICDGEHMLALLREYDIDYVVNFAAESHVDQSIDHSAKFIETNIVGVHRLLEAARIFQYDNSKENFRFLQVSTDEVFGSLEFDEKELFHENRPYDPRSPYSSSKASADHLVMSWHHTYGLPTLITHCSNNYGPRQFPEKLIPLMIQNALSGKDLGIYGNGENIRDWIHVEDHCNGILATLENGTIGKRYCFGGRAERSNNTIVNKICELLDQRHPRDDGKSYKDQITYIDDRLGHDLRYAIDDTLAETELSFERIYSFEKGISSTIEWYLTNDEWLQTMNKKSKAA